MARLVKPHGIRGWMKALSIVSSATKFSELAGWLLETNGKNRPVTISCARPIAGGFLLKLTCCDDRNAALGLAGSLLLLPRTSLPKLAEDEYYWHDLVGAKVTNQQGIKLGQIKDIYATTANNILVVAGNQDEVLIPWVEQHVLKIDLTTQQIDVDWPSDF